MKGIVVFEIIIIDLDIKQYVCYGALHLKKLTAIWFSTNVVGANAPDFHFSEAAERRKISRN